MRTKRKTENRVELNLTPVIDMVFLLLIFFLVATKYADIERDVRVKPPSSRNARPITAIPEEIVVNVTRDGEYLIGARRKDLADIDALLQTAVKQNPNQAVVVRGDGESALAFAVGVLDLCEKHRISRTYLTTRRAGQR